MTYYLGKKEINDLAINLLILFKEKIENKERIEMCLIDLFNSLMKVKRELYF